MEGEKDAKEPLWKKPAFTAIGTILVTILLLVNLLALAISLPIVSLGVLDEYSSSTYGSIEMPFIPNSREEITFNITGEPLVNSPFEVALAFSEGRNLYIPHSLEFQKDEKKVELPIFEKRSISDEPSPVCIVPGLPDPGIWSLGLKREVFGRVDRMEIGRIMVAESNPEDRHPFPLLGGINLGPDGLLIDRSMLNSSSIGLFSVRLNGGETMDIPPGSGAWNLSEVTDIDQGWHDLLVIRWAANGSYDRTWNYSLFNPGGKSQKRIISTPFLKRVFQGYDELYGQEREKEIQVARHYNYLYNNEYYSISFELSEEWMESILSSGDPLPDLTVTIDGNTYPLFYNGSGIFKGMLKVPSLEEDEDRFDTVIQDDSFGSSDFIVNFSVKLKRDRATILHFEGDPFRLETYSDLGDPVFYLLVYAEWNGYNRRDLSGEPLVVLGNRTLVSDRSDDLFLQERNYTLPIDLIANGEILVVDADTEFVFGTLVTFLLPLPQVIYPIPYVLEGYAALFWYFAMAAAVAVSVALLIFQGIKPILKIAKKGSRWGSADRVARLVFSERSPPVALAETFLAAMFFFFISIIMFELFETPTPGLDILSEETPIWMRMYVLAEASVWEEINGRVILIGLPLFFIHLMKGDPKGSWKNLLGGTNRFGSPEVFFVFFSGSLFGMAHLGWGPWKVLPTFVHGLIFGYLFIRIGLHATIALHFLFDFSDFFSEMIGLEPLLLLLAIMYSIGVGGIYLGKIIRSGQLWFADRVGEMYSRSYWLLIAHSGISALMGLLLLTSGKNQFFSALFLAFPLIDTVLYMISRRGLGPLARGASFVLSFFSVIASPFGFAWMVSLDDERFQP